MSIARKQLILDELKKEKTVKIVDLANTFNVSAVTIRKDVQTMEADGLLIKYHGRIALNESNNTISYNTRSQQNNAKKLAIAKVAADMIRDVRSITLDAGSTVNMIASQLTDYSNLSVVTNSLMIANSLAHTPCAVSVACGQLIGHSLCMLGPDTEDYLRGIRTELAFIGCTGLRGSEGLCTGMRLEACVKHALLKTGTKVVAVFDDSKLFTTGMHVFANFSEIDTIITTHSKEQPEALSRIEDLGINLIYADDIYPLS